jgi:hypothetical protein
MVGGGIATREMVHEGSGGFEKWDHSQQNDRIEATLFRGEI